MTDAFNTTAGNENFSNIDAEPSNYSYDANGNLITDSGKGITAIEYNHSNLPTKISMGANKFIEAAYDADGNRYYKNTSASNTAEYYIRDAGGQTMAVYDAAGTLKFHNIYAGGVIGKLVAENPQPKTFYYLQDHLGNIRTTVNESGNVVGSDAYYPFGLQMPEFSGNLSNAHDKYKFNGKELDDEFGLNWYYFGARFYDPALGRWTTIDPADEYWSPYLYVGNSPVSFIDPDGTNTYYYDQSWNLLSIQRAVWWNPLTWYRLFSDDFVYMAGSKFEEIGVQMGVSAELISLQETPMDIFDDAGNFLYTIQPADPQYLGLQPTFISPLDFVGGPASRLARASRKAPKITRFYTKPKINNTGKTVREILKGRKGSIKDAKLDKGSPSWNDILDMKWEDIVKAAKRRETGFKIFRKLLTDKRFIK